MLRLRLTCAAITTLLLAPCAYADWTIVQADAPVTVIHETGLYQADPGQRLAPNDIVETSSRGGVQIQDGAGNSVALDHDTRVLLTRDTHVDVLNGWLKVLHACDPSGSNCAALEIDTSRTRFAPSNDTALVIAASATGYMSSDAVFCESGTANVLAIGNPRAKSTPVRVDAHRFASHAPGSDAIAVTARPDPAFVTAMPVAFRDALHVLPDPATVRHAPPANLRPVAYADVSDWLTSSLAARKDPTTRFTSRFRTRIADVSFRKDVIQHVHDLPDWRPIVFPPPPPKIGQTNAVWPARAAYSSDRGRP